MIRLQRDVSVWSFDVEATVAVGRDRPEFLAVARLASDLRRPLGGAEVARELLGGLPESVGWRVIDRCVALRLLERERERGPARLTEAGSMALERGKVLVPEEGIWRFYCLEDPLVDEPLLHVIRLKAPNARAERDGLYSKGKDRQESRRRPSTGKELPELLQELEESDWDLQSICDGSSFQVLKVARKGEEGPSARLHLRLEWTETEGARVKLLGELPSPDEERQAWRVDASLGTPEACQGMDYDELWRDLVSAASKVPQEELEQWQQRAGERALPVTFDAGLDESVRRAMQKNLAVPSCHLEELGEFQGTQLSDVRLVPRSNRDAQAWAEWIQWDGLTDYATPDILREAASDFMKRFPYHPVRLLEPEALLKRALGTPADPRARYLLAPADLGLWS